MTVLFSEEEKRYIRAGNNTQQRIEQVLQAREIVAEFATHPIVIDDSEDNEEEEAPEIEVTEDE